MRNTSLFPILFLSAILASSCGQPKTAGNETHPAVSADSVVKVPTPKDSLRKQIGQIAEMAKGKVGVAVLAFEDNDTLSFHGTDHFPMQSVFKFPLSIAMLDQIDKGKYTLDDKIHFDKKDMEPGSWSPLHDKYPNGNVDIPLREILSYTVSKSDNSGCDKLFALLGGPQEVNKYIHSIGVKEINIVATELEMRKDWDVQYTNWCEPEAMLQLLQRMFQRKCLSIAGHDFLWKIMSETETGVKRIKGELPEGTPVAHKTGTGPTNKEGITSATNDAGVITLPNGKHVALVVFVADAKGDEKATEGTIAGIAKAVWDYYLRKH